MPGIIAIVGRSDAESVARRAARPLLRRPWQLLTIIGDEVGRAALGFAGERGAVVHDEESGVIVALDGELVGDGSESSARGAELLLRRYLDGHLDISAIDGWFSAAFWDPRRGELTLAADRMGHRPLYVARRGGEVFAAGELKALIAAGLRSEIDLQAWAEMLAYEHPLGDHVPLTGIRLVPPGTALTIAANGSRRMQEQWRYRLEPEERDGGPELVEEFGRLLEDAVTRRVEPDTALALSGGLDSRCLAAIVGPQRILAASYGAPGSEDLETGMQVAQLAGLPHRPLLLESGYIARGAADTVWLAEGHVRLFHTHHLRLSVLRAEERRSTLLIGFSGDPIVRASRIPSLPEDERDLPAVFHASRATCLTDALAEQLLTPSFAADIRGLARGSLAQYLAEEAGPPDVRMRQYVVRQSHRRKVFPGSELFLDDLAPRDPFDDTAVVEFCRRMPSAWRRGGRLQKRYLQGFGPIAALPSPKDGVAPRLDGRREALARFGVRVRRAARARVERAGGLRWLPNKSGLGDYAHDLRGASSPLLDLLLEPRTLARGQVREEPVRRLIGELRGGKKRHTRVLGMLLTFELFQRQFVDGERLTAPAADSERRVRA